MNRRRAILITACAALALTSCANKSTPNALDGAGSESHRVAGIWWIAFGAGAAVYAIVGGLVVYGALRKCGGELDQRRRTRKRIVTAVGGVVIPSVNMLFMPCDH